MRRKEFVYRIVFALAIVALLKVAWSFAPPLFYRFQPDIPGRDTVYPKQLLIQVNIPERALYLYQIYQDQQFLLKKYPCTVGTIEFKTPEGRYMMTEAIWNPGWLPPKSEWAKDLEPVEPGKPSPVKGAALIVDPEEAILIHGTAEESEIGKAASHGCVRLREKDMLDLLQFIQNNIPNSEGTANVSAYREHSHRSVRVDLEQPVSVQLLYRRAEAGASGPLSYPDIYDRGTGLTLTGTGRLISRRPAGTVSADLALSYSDKNGVRITAGKARGQQRTASALKEYFIPAKLRFFVWYVNNEGELRAWSRLRSKAKAPQ